MIKRIEDIIKVRDELYELQRKIEHLRRQLDGAAAEIIGFLKAKGHIE
jgi:hypothetical protein